jgi:hypothetical protein
LEYIFVSLCLRVSVLNIFLHLGYPATLS